MRKKIIISLLFLVIVISLVVIRNRVVIQKCVDVENAFMYMLSGHTDLSGYNIPKKVEEDLLEYQKNVTNEDDTEYILCDDVKGFNAYIQKYMQYENELKSLGVYQMEGEDIPDGPIFERNADFDTHLALDYIDNVFPNVYEDDNKYKIKYKDIYFDYNNQMYIYHKGYTYTIWNNEITKPCYYRRQLHGAEVIKTKDKFFEDKLLAQDITSSPVTLIVKKGLFSIRGIEIKDRGAFFND